MTTKKITASLLCAFLLLPAGNSFAFSKRDKIGISALLAAATTAWYYKDTLVEEFSKNPEKFIMWALSAAGIGGGAAIHLRNKNKKKALASSEGDSTNCPTSDPITSTPPPEASSDTGKKYN